MRMKQIHRRVNGWKLGDYAFAMFGGLYGFEAVGQLMKISTNERGQTVGHFAGFRMDGMRQHKPESWTYILDFEITEEKRASKKQIEAYERIVSEMNRVIRFRDLSVGDKFTFYRAVSLRHEFEKTGTRTYRDGHHDYRVGTINTNVLQEGQAI